jgi:exodeoxyribonuclease V gamma subunit
MAALDALSSVAGGSGRRPPGLPQRLIVFGISSLSMQSVQALAALGQVCQVLMLVQNPCQYYWGDLVEGHALLRQQLRRRQPLKPQPPSATAATHPLLASWGKQGRDYLHLLDGFDQPDQYRAHWRRVDLFVDPLAMARTQLAQLQSDILNLTPPPPAPVAQPIDGSIQFVTTHSAQRELEVLHDQLLAWLDADPHLQAREVMVMVPDMAVFAPHIHAVFGRFTPEQPRHVPYSVADTNARQSPLVQALAQLLNLPEARLTLAEWLSLFEVAAVRSRFGLDVAAVQQIQNWLQAAGVRWGLDAAHRRAWGLPPGAADLAHNTWAFGLRRLLLGYALGPVAGGWESGADGLWQGTLAQPALSGLDAALASALLEWVGAVSHTLPTLQADHSPAQWGQILRALVARFFASDDEAGELAIVRLLAPLDDWLQACEEAQLDTALPLQVVREHWLSSIAEVGLQQRFFGGGVQFGTLMPMRAIPFKVIALLGMNDGAYPRAQAARDFDLMASSWRAGDRSRREDDRYLFLEALLSARQKLYVSWQAHSATDNSVRPPSVLVAQLLDLLKASWSPPHQPQAQPLQPFSSAYFETGSGCVTYADDWQKIQPPALSAYADKATETVADPPPTGIFLTAPQVLRLTDLQRLLRQPVEVFLRQRLQVEFDRLDELEQEDEPFALNPLQQHQLGAALLQSGADAQALAKLHGAGVLPLAGFGQRAGHDLLDQAQSVWLARNAWLQTYPLGLDAVAVNLLLAPGLTLSGELAGLYASDGAAGSNTPCLQLAARTGGVLEGKAGARSARGHTLPGLWVRHLAGCASGLALTSVQLGVDGAVVFRPLTPDDALQLLKHLAQCHVAAWDAPLPLACKTAWAYLQTERHNPARLAAGKTAKDPHDVARAVFEGGQRGGELAESAYLQRVFQSYAELQPGLPHWAQRLYGDVLAHCELWQEGSP